MPHTTRGCIAGWIVPLLLQACVERSSGDECVAVDDSEPAANLVQSLPVASDWIDRGVILTAGAPGDWDHFLYGGFAGSVVKKGDTFFLYYQGARSYSEEYGTVTDRAIGVATSRDGIEFQKYEGNPVLTWQPNHGHEEGAASGTALLDRDGRVVLYYGANTAINDWLVNADGRVALSSDGFEFADVGVVLAHDDRAVWGHGDELFPIVSRRLDSTYLVYYVLNGRGRRGQMGVAWGPARTHLTSTAPVLSERGSVSAWGMGSSVELDNGRAAIFLNDVTHGCLEARSFDVSEPSRVSAPVRVYQFDNMSQGTMIREPETGTWYLYYRSKDASSYGVRIANVER